MTARLTLVMVLAGVAAAGPAAAAEILTELKTCHAESDDARRLACYDRLSGAKPAPTATPAPAAAPVAAATPLTPEEKFGYSDVRAQQEREAELADPDRKKPLFAKVVEATLQPNGTYVVKLDNGQVWRQTSLEDFFRLEVGDDVKIRPAAIGTFLLADPNGRSARVRRVE